MARREHEPVLRLAFDASRSHARHLRPGARPAQRLDGKDPFRRVRRMPCDERIPVRAHVRMAFVEERLVLVRRKRIGEAACRRLAVERIRERLSAVCRHDRPPHADDVERRSVRLAEVKADGPAGRTLHAERPVEPFALRVAQILADAHRVALNRVDNRVSGWNLRINGETGHSGTAYRYCAERDKQEHSARQARFQNRTGTFDMFHFNPP